MSQLFSLVVYKEGLVCSISNIRFNFSMANLLMIGCSYTCLSIIQSCYMYTLLQLHTYAWNTLFLKVQYCSKLFRYIILRTIQCRKDNTFSQILSQHKYTTSFLNIFNMQWKFLFTVSKLILLDNQWSAFIKCQHM